MEDESPSKDLTCSELECEVHFNESEVSDRTKLSDGVIPTVEGGSVSNTNSEDVNSTQNLTKDDPSFEQSSPPQKKLKLEQNEKNLKVLETEELNKTTEHSVPANINETKKRKWLGVTDHENFIVYVKWNEHFITERKIVLGDNLEVRGTLDVPDSTMCDEFIINTNSDVGAIPVAVEKGVNYHEPQASFKTSMNLDNSTKASASPMRKKIKLKTKQSSDMKKITQEKKFKKYGCCCRHSKNIRESRDTYDNYDSDYDSKRRKTRKRDSNRSDYSYCRSSEQKKKGDYESDSNSDNHEIKAKRGTCSRVHKYRSRRKIASSCSKEYTDEESIEIIEERTRPRMLYEKYSCEVCNLTVNSFATYQSHMSGQRHHKQMNMRNVDQAVTRNFIATEEASKYPKPPPGYYRQKLHEPAKIQHFINKLRSPCPGLKNITEIQGIIETSYYCSLCDSLCSTNSIISHVCGFKHQLNCLRYFKKDLYLRWRDRPKYQIEQRVVDELRTIESMYGRDLVKVKRDFSERDNPVAEIERPSWREVGLKSRSAYHKVSDADFSKSYRQASVPDPAKSGFYCKVCDSHSNSWSMWQSHIVGKRHLTNLKKAPGTAPSKRKYIPAPTARAYLLDELKNVYAAVVGLNQIREIRKPDIDGVTYNCFLCCSCISSSDIVDHILSRKHREKYLEDLKHPELETLRRCEMRDSAADSIIEEICSKVEAEKGRGKPEVYYDKNAVCKG